MNPSAEPWADLLERAASGTEPGAPPLAAIRAGARRRRRRRRAGVAALGVTVLTLATLSTTALVRAADVDPPSSTPIASDPDTDPDTDAAQPPARATRTVGVGHLTIAVPRGWGTNLTECGTPVRDTVVVDVGVVELCARPRPQGVTSVTVLEGMPPFDFRPDRTESVAGVTAQRQSTTCTGGPAERLCAGTVYVPELRAGFRAESTTSSEEVDRLLAGVGLDDERVGVPGLQQIALRAQGRSGEQYAARLAEAGLVAEVRSRRTAVGVPGFVLEASPAPGTMVAPGSTVVVTVTAGR